MPLVWPYVSSSVEQSGSLYQRVPRRTPRSSHLYAYTSSSSSSGEYPLSQSPAVTRVTNGSSLHSWGPGAWVVTGEIFPLKSRAKALGMTSSSNWLLNWALAYATPFMVNSGKGNANLGSKVFFIWGSLCVLCAVFVHFFIYETKGMLRAFPITGFDLSNMC